MLGRSRVFLDLLDDVSRVAPLDRPILVIGERGTGKELIAGRLHFLSPRWGQPFIKLNCAAIPETLIESELFGHEAGAFTGARGQHAGRFERADGGTLFLDEIGILSAAAQEKLLRVLEYGEFERLGGSETISVDVRVVGAANQDLPTLVNRGKFRPDLLDRLAFDVLTLPPLRARTSDIMEIAGHFARAMAGDLDWPSFPGFTQDIVATLEAYPWPGNVRELRNVVERAVYRAPEGHEAPLTRVDFDPFDSPWRPVTSGDEGAAEPGASGTTAADSEERSTPAVPDMVAGPFDYKARIYEFERDLLSSALAANRHRQGDTANFLSLSYDQLRHGLKKHGLLPG